MRFFPFALILGMTISVSASDVSGLSELTMDTIPSDSDSISSTNSGGTAETMTYSDYEKENGMPSPRLFFNENRNDSQNRTDTVVPIVRTGSMVTNSPGGKYNKEDD